MNYKEELEKMQKLNENVQDFWKPTSGVYDIEFLSEPEHTTYTFKDQEPKKQLRFTVKVNSQVYNWNVTLSSKPKSTYYQLLKVAIMNGDKFTGAKIKIQVTEFQKGNVSLKTYYIL